MNGSLTLRRHFPAAAATALALLTLLGTGPAQAGADEHGVQTLTTSVRYDDLDLSTNAGARTLYQRIVTAARRVCPDDQSRSPKLARAVRQCRAAVINEAVSEIGSPQLAAVRAAHLGTAKSG